MSENGAEKGGTVPAACPVCLAVVPAGQVPPHTDPAGVVVCKNCGTEFGTRTALVAPGSAVYGVQRAVSLSQRRGPKTWMDISVTIPAGDDYFAARYARALGMVEVGVYCPPADVSRVATSNLLTAVPLAQSPLAGMAADKELRAGFVPLRNPLGADALHAVSRALTAVHPGGVLWVSQDRHAGIDATGVDVVTLLQNLGLKAADAWGTDVCQNALIPTV